jgi:hypothetical protein
MRGPKQRAVLAMPLAEGNRVVPAGRLIDTVGAILTLLGCAHVNSIAVAGACWTDS